MKTIISDNAEVECQNMITAFLDEEFIKSKIVEAYPNLSATKQKTVSEDIRFYINQGLELYTVSDTSINTIPLTLFYALNNFVKAAYLLQFPNLSLTGSHGMELKSNELEVCNSIGEVTVHFTKKGTFANLIELTNEEFDLASTVLLKDLFSVIPELCNIYALVYSEEANVYLMQGKKECASTYKVFFQTNNGKEISCRDTSLLSRNGYHLYIQNDYDGICGDLSLTQDSWGKENNVIYYDFHGNKYCTNGIKFGGDIIKPSKICNLYICYYTFSMLVRYYPSLWIKFCNLKEVSLINKLLTNMKSSMLIEIAQLLSGERYIFTAQIAEMDKDIDYSEVLKKLLKEIGSENRRRGQSILLDYI